MPTGNLINIRSGRRTQSDRLGLPRHLRCQQRANHRAKAQSSEMQIIRIAAAHMTSLLHYLQGVFDIATNGGIEESTITFAMTSTIVSNDHETTRSKFSRHLHDKSGKVDAIAPEAMKKHRHRRMSVFRKTFRQITGTS